MYAHMYPRRECTGSAFGSSTVIGVSSVCTLREESTLFFMASTIGAVSPATWATQSHRVDNDSGMLDRRYRSCIRYSGRCSAYLLAIRSARTPGPGMPLSSGRGGSGPWLTEPWQCGQAYLCRT
jgi:hypothetical protein